MTKFLILALTLLISSAFAQDQLGDTKSEGEKGFVQNRSEKARAVQAQNFGVNEEEVQEMQDQSHSDEHSKDTPKESDSRLDQ